MAGSQSTVAPSQRTVSTVQLGLLGCIGESSRVLAVGHWQSGLDDGLAPVAEFFGIFARRHRSLIQTDHFESRSKPPDRTKSRHRKVSELFSAV